MRPATTATDSDVTLDRTRRASRVLAMALVDGGAPGNPGGAAPSGAPAEVFAEAKGTGFDTKAMRSIIRLRKKDQAERQEEESILDLYKAALGMV